MKASSPEARRTSASASSWAPCTPARQPTGPSPSSRASLPRAFVPYTCLSLARVFAHTQQRPPSPRELTCLAPERGQRATVPGVGASLWAIPAEGLLAPFATILQDRKGKKPAFTEDLLRARRAQVWRFYAHSLVNPHEHLIQ